MADPKQPDTGIVNGDVKPIDSSFANKLDSFRKGVEKIALRSQERPAPTTSTYGVRG